MPAHDLCEEAVIHAFEKDHWRVKDKPYLIRLPSRRRKLFADVRFQQELTQSIIVIEVKCFATGLMDEFYGAVGQYLFYQAALDLAEIPDPLYLSVPQPIYATLFQEEVVQLVWKRAKMKLVVVNLEQEEIVQWIH